MAKPETTFYTSVHKHLPPAQELHREKMNNPYSSGTADFWFSGRRDLWVEYKFILLPKRDTTLIDLTAGKSPGLSVLQQHWLRSRIGEGRNVWVIVGCKEGGVIMRSRGWELPWPTGEFKKQLLSRQAIAGELLNFLGTP